MPKFPQPKAPGFVHPATGRVAVLVGDLADSDLNGDVPAYFYSEEAEGLGFDPWRVIEGIDAHTGGQDFDVCFACGTYRTVGPLMTVFLSAADAARLAAEKTRS